ncbi:MAG: S26 family signal peptidase [Chloroflexota bacterium]
MLKLLKISGNSLEPVYQEGDFALVSKIPYLFVPVRPGDVVVLRHRLYGTLIKHVARVTESQDAIHVLGTNDWSIDSREFGPIRRQDIVGKVIWHIKRPRPSHSEP